VADFLTRGLVDEDGRLLHGDCTFEWTLSTIDGRWWLQVPSIREDRTYWRFRDPAQEAWLRGFPLEHAPFELSWWLEPADARVLIGRLAPTRIGRVDRLFSKALGLRKPAPPRDAVRFVTRHERGEWGWTVVVTRAGDEDLWVVRMPEVWRCKEPEPDDPAQAEWLRRAVPAGRWEGIDLFLETPAAQADLLVAVAPGLEGTTLPALRTALDGR
jgi:hypothetical protein